MIGIVIVNYNTWEITCECVKSIRSTCKEPYTIYVVDNASPNDSIKQLNLLYSGSCDVVVIPSTRNGGYGPGLNLGLTRAKVDGCDAIIASNNDIIYLENSITNLYAALKKHPEVAVVGAQQVGTDGKPQSSDSKFYYSVPQLILWYMPFSHRLFKGAHGQYDFALELEPSQEAIAYPLGGCYMFDASFIDDDGLYDERIFMYGEEPVLGAKLREKGKLAILEKAAVVIHKHHATTGFNMAMYHLRAAPSVYLYAKEYAKIGDLGLAIHKGLFYVLMVLKSVCSRQYRAIFSELMHVQWESHSASGAILNA